MNKNILIIDDKEKLCRNLARNLSDEGYKVFTALNSRAAYQLLESEQIRVILLDLSLGSENGLDVLEQLKSLYPQVVIIMMTGYGTLEIAVQAIKSGAMDFIQKPLDFDKLIKLIENGCAISKLDEENVQLKERITSLTPQMITQNDELLAICEKAKRLAPTNLPVLITGESGTGKELMAEFIHNHSKHAPLEMHHINCAAFPENLLDSELFGYEKGAFTGADKQFTGIFEKAHNSSLHMDEIGDMAFSTQTKILRALQNHEIKRIGGSDIISVHFRVIASTNRDLQGLIDEGNFRKDLFFRLNAAIIHLPPLRARKDDIPLLIEHFIKHSAKENGTVIKTVSTDTMKLLMSHDWPGNIRELKNVINYAYVVSFGTKITIDDLPEAFRPHKAKSKAEKASPSLRESERDLIRRTLQETKNNKKKAAEILNISRNTLYNKIAKYGL